MDFRILTMRIRHPVSIRREIPSRMTPMKRSLKPSKFSKNEHFSPPYGREKKIFHISISRYASSIRALKVQVI